VATIDDKVVSMSFESRQFEEGVQRTLDALAKLQAGIKHLDMGAGLTTMASSVKEVDLGHISNGIDSISHKLGALRLAAIAVFADIAKKAVSMGTSLLKSVTLSPLKTGLAEYETQINAVQTIMANTSAAGTKLQDVNKALSELNDYADKTIYNFGEMTKNIGLFTAAGVDLKTSVASIKGIANLAAVSGSNAEAASRAMYQLSQAISSGTVKLMDWRSVVNAGMGGTVFQRALANTAVHMGTLDKGAVSLSGSMKNVKINGEKFSASLASAGPGKESWLTGKVLTETLKQLSGDMSTAQLKAQGYTDAQVKAIQTQAKLAVEAATKVKTLSQLLSTTREQLGTGWARTWMLVFGDFGEAKVLFTGLSNAIGGFISANAQARNKVLKAWKDLGGRKKLISGLKIAFQDLQAVLKPIKQAFRDIFPPITGKQLYDLTVRFKHFMQELKPSPETINLLHRTFRGLFALLDIGKQVLFGIFRIFGKVFGQIGKGSGGFLEFTAKIGDWLYKVDQALKKGKGLEKFFDAIGKALAAPIKALQFLSSLISAVFSGGAAAGAKGMTKAVGPLGAAFDALGRILHRVFSEIKDLAGIFEPILQAWINLLAQLPSLIAQGLSHMSWEPVLAVIRTGLLAGIFLMFKKFLGKGAGIDQLTGGLMKSFSGLGVGLVKNISGSFAALTGSLNALQTQLKAKTLKEIAIAVALLTVSMVALSFVDPKKLNSALGAITIAFGQLLGAMAILGNVSKSLGFIKMPVIAATLIILAGAIFTLSASVLVLSRLSWEELTKGLVGVGVLLGALILATGPLSAASFGMMKAGIGLTAIAVGLNILALAVLAFGKMDLMTLGKGMASIGVGLFIIATYIKLFPKGPGMILQGAGLIAIAVGLNILALAVLALGKMNLTTLGKGLGAIGVALAIIAGAMRLMPKTMALQAAGLVLVAGALMGIATAVRIMGGASLVDLAKGLGGLAYSLGLLAGMLNLMTGTITGALALGIAAASIAILVPALILLGNQDIKTIAVGLISLAVAFGIIAAAGILLDAAAPGLLAFGAAVALVGAGLALAGAGIFLAAAGIAALVTAVVIAAGVIPKAMADFQGAMIKNAKNLVLGVLQIVAAFADTAPLFVDSIVKILNSILDAIIQIVPKVQELANVLITALLEVIDQQQGPIVEGILGLVMAILDGIRMHIGEIVATVLLIVKNILLAIAQNIDDIARAGAKIVVALVQGIAGAYRMVITAVLGIISRFLNAIANNLGKIVTAGGNIVIKFLQGIARNVTRIATAATNVIVAFINAIGNNGPRIVTAATNTIIKLATALQQNANKMADAGFKIIIAFINGLTKTINEQAPQLRTAALKLGYALVNGMSGGIIEKAGEVVKAVGDLVKKAKDKAKFWDSPPESFGKKIGQGVVLGMAEGLKENSKAVDAAKTMNQGVIDTMNDIWQIRSPSQVTYVMGLNVVKGFVAGLKKGTKEDMQQALSDFRQQIAQQISELKQKIQEENQKIREIRKEKKGPQTDDEKKRIAAINVLLGQQNVKLQALLFTQKNLNKAYNANKTALFEQAKKYSDLLTKIEAVKEIVKEFKDQYSDLPEIISEEDDTHLTGATQLKKYTEALTKQVGAVQKYNETLQKLRALGLDDETYRMLLEKGTSGQEFADALVQGGKPAVDSINALDTQLDSATQTLGDNAADKLYKAGEEAARGLVAGLEAQLPGILTAIGTLVDTMVNKFKHKLKIKSPSEVFAELGGLSMEGLAQGFEESTPLVTDAADQAAKDALVAMERSMRDISDVVTEQLDTNPVITPILDLSQVKAKQAELAALTDAGRVSANYAASISSGTAAAAAAAAEADKVAAIGTNFKFEQNNYSPEALSDIDIYRQTKNQLSQIKAALGVT
jgi:tape measure domain-containing protein